MRAQSVLAVGLMLLAFGTRAGGQPPVFRVDADLVVVDLVPTDRSGAFVADLQPSDVELLENGRTQKIEFLRLVQSGRPPAPSGTTAVSLPAPAGTVANPSSRVEAATVASPGSGTTVAIVLDMATIPADAMGRVREAIATMVDRELPPDTRILVASVSDGINIHQPFTADRTAVKAALQSLPPLPGSPVGFREMLDTADQLCEVAATRVDPMPAFQQLIALGKAMLFDNRRQMAAMAEGLKALSRSVAAMPGRKHVVLYSVGYPLDPVTHIIELAVSTNSTCAGTDPAGAPNRLGATGRDQSAGSLRQRIAEELSGAATFDVAGTLQGIIDRANRAQVSFTQSIRVA